MMRLPSFVFKFHLSPPPSWWTEEDLIGQIPRGRKIKHMKVFWATHGQQALEDPATPAQYNFFLCLLQNSFSCESSNLLLYSKDGVEGWGSKVPVRTSFGNGQETKFGPDQIQNTVFGIWFLKIWYLVRTKFGTFGNAPLGYVASKLQNFKTQTKKSSWSKFM